MINDYKSSILEKLLTKYERSILSKRESKNNSNISLKYDSVSFNDYVSEDSYLYEEDITYATKELENNNYLSILYKKDGRISKVNLNLERIDDAYCYINRVNPRLKRESFLEIITSYKSRNKVLLEVCNYLENEINKFHSIDFFAKDEGELDSILYLIDKLTKQQEEIPMRVFSVRYLNDSKKLEQMLPKVESLIRKSCLFVDDDILGWFNVVKNPTMVFIKGKLIFSINDQQIDLEKLDSVFALSNEHLRKFRILELNVDRVTTIENLTTFYNYPLKRNELVIYLGGFHNHLRKELLKKIYDAKANIDFVHIGDIDAGGFYILNHLISDTSIPFNCEYMDVETLIKYKDYTRGLTKEDRQRLEQLMCLENTKKYKDVILYMLENNMKLEQEAIDFDIR